MIRRAERDSFILVQQHDHALLAGQLAAHLGNDRFRKPDPTRQTISAVCLHDCGWTQDEELTLNEQGLPLDVFESPLPLAIRAWRASVDRAAEAGDFAQMLVSLHVLGLSAIPASRHHTPREVFELNKFQHHEIERQEQLRPRLGLRSDVPLRHGLADPGASAADDLLSFNLRILQAMDRISLALLCTTQSNAPASLFERIDDLPPAPGGRPVPLRLTWDHAGALVLSPWPFDVPRLDLEVPCKRLPARTYRQCDEYRTDYQQAANQMLSVSLRAPGVR